MIALSHVNNIHSLMTVMMMIMISGLRAVVSGEAGGRTASLAGWAPERKAATTREGGVWRNRRVWD